MVTVISPDQMIIIPALTWESFKWWFFCWQLTSLVEMVTIIVLISYSGRGHWTLLGKKIIFWLKNINTLINQAQYNCWKKKNQSDFNINKFLAFVLSSLFTFMALCSVLVLGYFAVMGENITTYNSPESVQIVAANYLLWRMGFIQNFLWAIFIISLLVIFRDYIEFLLKVLQNRNLIIKPKIEIPIWVYRGLRYSILILFTVFSFLALYNMALIIPSSIAGSTALTQDIANNITDIQAKGWCNLATIYNPIAFGFLGYWICSVWLMAFGYLLNYELNYICEIIKQFLYRVYKSIPRSNSEY